MKNRVHIKKGDNVVVISGKDKGKKDKYRNNDSRC